MDKTGLQELLELKDNYFKEIEDKAKDAVKELVKSFMTEHPEVKELIWSQYTPYFNDGDVCEFGVNDPRVILQNECYNKFKGTELYEEDIDSYGLQAWDFSPSNNTKITNNWVPESLYHDLRELSGMICGNSDAMRFAFGDHVEVRVTKGEIIVDEYNHD